MYDYISTIDYDRLKMLFDDYNQAELDDLYDKYNGVTLLQKSKDEVKDFDIQEFLIYQNQLRGMYHKDPDIFSDENIKLEIFRILESNVNKEGKQVC